MYVLFYYVYVEEMFLIVNRDRVIGVYIIYL